MMSSPSISSLLNSSAPTIGSDPADYFACGPDEHFAPPVPVPVPFSPSPVPATLSLKKRPRSPSPSPPPPPPPPRPSSSAASQASQSQSQPQPQPQPPRQPTATPAAAPRHPIEPSIFNVEPIDEFTREVADWLWAFAGEQDWNVVEIEAKIGLLVDSKQRTRVSLPVPIETILMDDTGIKFESNMTINQHKAFNVLLNSRVEESASPAYAFAPIRYAHVRERDAFHVLESSGGGARRKLRVTTDQKDGRELRVVEKSRIADMNVLSPKRGFDWRISVNTEVPARTPPTHSNPTMTRNKDRISYSHQLFQVDLTQVTQGSGGPVMHELEIEFKDARVLLAEGRKEQEGQDNKYLEMVQAFLNNIRMLIRNAAEP